MQLLINDSIYFSFKVHECIIVMNKLGQINILNNINNQYANEESTVSHGLYHGPGEF